MKIKEPVIVIGALDIIEELDHEYDMEHSHWMIKCKAVRDQFRQKTSRMEKNGKTYEYTKWYRMRSEGGLECIGSQAPDFNSFYPPEPKQKYSFGYNEYNEHLLIEKKDYEANRELFVDCLAFRLEDCINQVHPLYASPETALKEYDCDSVHGRGVSSARSARSRRTESNQFCMGCGESFIGSMHRCKEKVSPEKALAKINSEDMCMNDGNCYDCECQEECPVTEEVE